MIQQLEEIPPTPENEWLIELLAAQIESRMQELDIHCPLDGFCYDTDTALSRTNTNLIRGVPFDLWWRMNFEILDEPFDDADEVPDRRRRVLAREYVRDKIIRMVKDNYRSFDQILKGDLAYSETLGYRIEKFDLTTPQDRFVPGPHLGERQSIQSFFLGNHDDVEIVRFIDSQLKYAKRYKYRVHQVVGIIGTEYAYANCMTSENLEKFTNADPQKPFPMLVGVVHRPEIRIYEIPVHEREIAIIDDPPVPPNINVIPFKGDRNKVMFNMDSNTGEFYARPIYLEPDDEEQFALAAAFQGANLDTPENSEEGLIRFKNDDPVNIFEVFRISEPPLGWDSFFDKKVSRIVSDATCASYIDNIIPNKKYYYTFRNEDAHGHVSNPTHVYEVELINNLDMVYLKFRIYDFRESIRPRPSVKNLQKRIQIAPSFEQKLFPLPDSGLSSDWDAVEQNLGLSEHPLWSKKFKMRVTSKSTGKRIEVNFRFRKNYVKVDNNPCDEDEAIIGTILGPNAPTEKGPTIQTETDGVYEGSGPSTGRRLVEEQRRLGRGTGAASDQASYDFPDLLG